MRTERVTVTVLSDKGGGVILELEGRSVEGTAWAATPALDEDDEIIPGKWAITHVPTGRALRERMALDLEAAARILANLVKEVPDFGMNLTIGDDVYRKTPGSGKVLLARRAAMEAQGR